MLARVRRLLPVVAVVAALLPPTPAAGAGDPYAADPLRLVPFRDTVQQVYTFGTDTFEVWICNVPGWDPLLDPGTVAADLERVIAPYFTWLSGGRYRPTFRAGGEVIGTDVISAQPAVPEAIFAPDCEAKVEAAATSSPNGVVIVTEARIDAGYATAGAVCPEAPFSGCSTTYPGNARRVVLGAATVTTLAPFAEPQWITAAHELGHTLNWAHSYGGLTTDPATGAIDRYDNPMDVMSGGAHTGLPIGAIAYHRYAAGWIDPAEVAVHSQGVATYQLAAPGNPGTQMLVVRGESEGTFTILGARRRTSYDAALPKAGVEVYLVDQRPELACVLPPGLPATWPCFATFVRLAQTPAVVGENGTSHVLGIDEQTRVGRFLVTVLAADTGSFTIRLSEEGSGRFIDDDGNPHEADIEEIARLAITLGCNPPVNDRYCPTQSVTRAEMAAFLVRALDEEANLPPFRGLFPDVPAGAWYTPYVERLAELGITTGEADGTYRPGAAVSRAEMSAFLIRAFAPGASAAPTGRFVDVPVSDWYAGFAEGLYLLGVTKGCSTTPLAYCPAAPVRRDQMASFLVRSIPLR